MQQQTFTLDAVNFTSINQQLGFWAKSVLVDNYTNGYVRIPGTVRDVPPYIFGAVLSIQSATQAASAQIVGIRSSIVGPILPNSVATLTFMGDAVTPSPGHLLMSTTINVPGVPQVNPASAPAANQTQIGQALPAGPSLFVSYDQFFANGGVTTLIVPTPGLQIFLFDVIIAVDVAVAGGIFMQYTNGIVTPLLHSFDLSEANPEPYHGRGLPIPVGNGIRFQNGSGANVQLRGSLTYAQVQS